MHRQRSPNRLPAWVPAIWLVTVVVALTVPANAAHAAHPNTDPLLHINFMHYATPDPDGLAGRDEQFCVESHDTAKVSHADARAFVYQTLTQMGSGKVWDGLGSWRIDLWPTNKNCSAYSQATRNTLEIEVHYGWDWSGICGPPVGRFNCVRHSGVVDDPRHDDARKAVVYLVFSSGGRLDDVGRAFINHEFGHVWGLADWTSTTQPDPCTTKSIMHTTKVSYACDNWLNWYPSSDDFQSVLRLMA